jgi:uncharacterized protein (UPF0333 family)
MLKNKKGQSTLEYVILVTAVIVVILIVVFGKSSPFQTTLNSSLNTSISQVNTMTGRLVNAYQ